jgi:hypothetical protein
LSRFIECFGKNFNCRLQGECVTVGRCGSLLLGQAEGSKLDLMLLIDGERESRGEYIEETRIFVLQRYSPNHKTTDEEL